MKNVEDLISSASSIHARYSVGRIERETVREWVLGLSEYPQPYAANIRRAADWFKVLSRPEIPPDELKVEDLDRLRSIFRP
ncbi:hypothetical protein AB4Z52_24905 [Rhizobium sp. 2YAF20]|uniref:hypothetical protein n=1 Tax=Rhizobium sp. 2YAF20 TaxID=3233027 RepID=UPI003F9C60F2